MGKSRHKWHCGECHNDLIVMRRAKGTKYLYCPHCDKQVAYFNIAPLVLAALSSILPTVVEKGAELIGLGKKDSSTQESPKSPRRLSGFEKALLLEKVEVERHGKTKKSKYGIGGKKSPYL